MQNGETIEKKAECQTCTCQDVGEMTCREIVCPFLNCKEDQLEARNDDECCSYCESISCTAEDGTVHSGGEQWSGENGKTCTCSEAGINCVCGDETLVCTGGTEKWTNPQDCKSTCIKCRL